jgi:hypothetical protein
VDNFTKYATNDFGLKNLRTVTRQSLSLELEKYNSILTIDNFTIVDYNFKWRCPYV